MDLGGPLPVSVRCARPRPEGWSAPTSASTELVYVFSQIPGVTPPDGSRGFGSHALRIRKKIFVMVVRGRLVVKLPKARVDALVESGQGVRFDANKGTPIKEWLSLDPVSSRRLGRARPGVARVRGPASCRACSAVLFGILRRSTGPSGHPCHTPVHAARMANTSLRDGPRPDTVSRRTDALVASVAQHHRAVSAHQRQLLSAVAELDRRKAWRIDGATTMVAWLVQRCSVTASTAREWVTAAEKLESLPEDLRGAVAGQALLRPGEATGPSGQARHRRPAGDGGDEWSAKQVRELAVAANRQTDSQAAGNHARRFLRFDDRRRSFSGCLARGPLRPGQGSTDCSSRTAPERRRDIRTTDGGCTGRGRAVSATPVGVPSKRTTVVVHADLTYLAGEVDGVAGAGGAELDVLGPLSPEVARRLACDAKIILSADNEKGHSIQQGTASRNPSPAQRLEIRRRDKGCRFPGCTYTEFTDVHHVVHWLNGGPTAIPNLVDPVRPASSCRARTRLEDVG